MLFAQFLFGLVLIVGALAALGLGVWLACWLVLLMLRRLPLIGQRYRHPRWGAIDQMPRRS